MRGPWHTAGPGSQDGPEPLIRFDNVVKRFGELGPSIEQAVKAYADEVRARTFPGVEHTYPMREATVAKLPERGKGPSRA